MNPKYRIALFSIVAVALIALLVGTLNVATAGRHATISLEQIGRYETGIFDEGAAEIVDHDPATQRLFVVNADAAQVDVLDVSDPEAPVVLFAIDATPYGDGANSVAVHNGVVAVAVEAEEATDPGSVVFFDTDGNYLNDVTVGSLPDMVTFSPDGNWVLVANEGEPDDDYVIDPEGSVSVIDVSMGAAEATQTDVRTADFGSLNGRLDPRVRIFGPGATPAQDLEPEYIAVSDDSRRAWVALQENNGLAIIDIRRARVIGVVGLGVKNHDVPGNSLDVSDKDDEINITNWPVYGMYQPDTIASYSFFGRTFIVTANEGDARDYDGFSEEERVDDLALDPFFFPNADELQEEEALGRLQITTANGDFDNDGEYEALFSYGARSFSIWTGTGRLIYDSGDDFEQITAAMFPGDFNSDNDENDSFDSRSDAKGPEPEGLTIGKVGHRTYAFIGLERIGGIMVYDITNPFRPSFVEYTNNRDFSGDAEAGTAGDLAPEGLVFIPTSESPTGEPLLVVSNEVSGTVTIYRVNQQ